MPNVAPTHINTLPQAPPQAIDVPALATTIKQNMTWMQYLGGMLDSLYWLSPIGKLHNKEKHNLYWNIKAAL